MPQLEYRLSLKHPDRQGLYALLHEGCFSSGSEQTLAS
ncbi:hypothetical protein KR51_00015480 [Rubidibacter lacunae KORDI 51-2]|uniref:Uncharacterized protein n=1 Tax=Rubidibacter lacunae KORDI 51-2 TaxID=582515 RepID=U5DPS9_9CHRO|nr:hypothetical protein KR51_00015480 [Rubidibacter lacunae KORDI 51-2]